MELKMKNYCLPVLLFISIFYSCENTNLTGSESVSEIEVVICENKTFSISETFSDPVKFVFSQEKNIEINNNKGRQ